MVFSCSLIFARGKDLEHATSPFVRTQHPKRNIYQGKEDSKLVVDTPANRNIDPRVDALCALPPRLPVLFIALQPISIHSNKFSSKTYVENWKTNFIETSLGHFCIPLNTMIEVRMREKKGKRVGRERMLDVESDRNRAIFRSGETVGTLSAAVVHVRVGYSRILSSTPVSPLRFSSGALSSPPSRADSLFFPFLLTSSRGNVV